MGDLTTADLRWRNNIITSIRRPDGWVEVRGDVLESGQQDCISVRQVTIDEREAWALTHLGTGSRIVTMPDPLAARLVAEEIVAAAPAGVWESENSAWVAETLRDILTPILTGRRCFFAGRWRAGA